MPVFDPGRLAFLSAAMSIIPRFYEPLIQGDTFEKVIIGHHPTTVQHSRH